MKGRKKGKNKRKKKRRKEREKKATRKGGGFRLKPSPERLEEENENVTIFTERLELKKKEECFSFF